VISVLSMTKCCKMWLTERSTVAFSLNTRNSAFEEFFESVILQIADHVVFQTLGCNAKLDYAHTPHRRFHKVIQR